MGVTISGRVIQGDADAFYKNGGVVVREPYPRSHAFGSAASYTSGNGYAFGVVLYAGDVVQKIAMRSNGTAAVAPTAWWFALYDDASTPALISQTTDQTSTAWGANTTMELSLPSEYTVPRNGLYYVVFSMTAGTVVGMNMPAQSFQQIQANNYFTGQKALALQFTGGGLGGTAPATLGSFTASSQYPYFTVRQ